MRKEIKKNKKVRMLGKVIVVIIAASASLWLLIQLFSWADRHDQNELMKQKECWKAIYTIIEKSPRKRPRGLRKRFRSGGGWAEDLTIAALSSSSRTGRITMKAEAKANNRILIITTGSKILKTEVP